MRTFIFFEQRWQSVEMPCIIESGFNPSPFQALQPEFLYAPDAQVLYADTGRTVARPSVVHTYWQTRAWARFFLALSGTGARMPWMGLGVKGCTSLQSTESLLNCQPL